MKDGWHVICGCKVYVEDGYIIRGVIKWANSSVTAYVYRRNPKIRYGWNIEDKITPAAFRAGFKRGTIRLI